MSTSLYQRFVSGSALILVGKVLSLGLAFAIRVILGRLLGPERYGTVALGFTVATVAIVFANGGLSRGIARNLPLVDPDSENGLVLSGFTLATCFSLATATALIVLSPLIAARGFGNPALAPIIAVFAVLVPFKVIRQVIVGTFRGYEQVFERVVINDFVTPVSRFVFIGSVAFFGIGTYYAAVAWVAAAGFTMVVAGLFLVSRTDLRIRGQSKSQFTAHMRPLLSFSLPLMFSAAMWNVIQQADNLLLGVFTTTKLVGQYDAAFSIAKLILVALGAFSFLFMPMFSKLHSAEEIQRMNRFYQTSTKWIASLTLPLFLMLFFFPKVIITTLFSADYSPAATALRVIAIGLYVHVLSGLAGNAMVSIGRTRTILKANIGIAVLNILLNIVFIPILGIVGAAAASAISYAILNLAYLSVLYREGIMPFSSAGVVPIFMTTTAAAIGSTVITSATTVTFWMVVLFLFLIACLHTMFYFLAGGVEEEDIELIAVLESETGVDLSYLKELAS